MSSFCPYFGWDLRASGFDPQPASESVLKAQVHPMAAGLWSPWLAQLVPALCRVLWNL